MTTVAGDVVNAPADISGAIVFAAVLFGALIGVALSRIVNGPVDHHCLICRHAPVESCRGVCEDCLDLLDYEATPRHTIPERDLDALVQRHERGLR